MKNESLQRSILYKFNFSAEMRKLKHFLTNKENKKVPKNILKKAYI